MTWDAAARAALIDELSKVADIDLSGLSPQTVLQGSQPAPPMETPGTSKALEVLERLDMQKTKVAYPMMKYTLKERAAIAATLALGGTAAMSKAKLGPFKKTAAPSMNQFSMPGFDTLASRSSGGNGRGKRPDVVVVDRAKSLGAHAIGAAAAGKMIGEALPHAQAAREVVRKAGRTGMLAGAALGAGEFARKRLMEARQRKQLMKTSEAMGLPQQSSKNTGKLKQMVRKSAGPVAVERKAGGALKGFHHG